MSNKFVALLLGLTALPTILACTKATAEDYNTYVRQYPAGEDGSIYLDDSSYNGDDSNDSSYDNFSDDIDNPWVEWGQEGVDNVGFGRKRQSNGFSCSSSEVCLYADNFRALLCYNQAKSTIKYETGLMLDLGSGDIVTADGEEGNLFDGPCPGPDFNEAETGDGCFMVSVSEAGSDDGDGDSDDNSDDSSDDNSDEDSDDNSTNDESTTDEDETNDIDNNGNGGNGESAGTAMSSSLHHMLAVALAATAMGMW